MIQFTLSRIWYFAMHPRLPLRDRVLAGMWRAGEDTEAIADALDRDTTWLRDRVRKLRGRGVRLPKRTRAESCRRRVAAKTERACLCCRVPFLSEGAGHRICDTCKGSDVWEDHGSRIVA